MTHLILDADILLFQVMSSLEVDVELQPDVWTRFVRIDDARQEYYERVAELQHKFDATDEHTYHCFTTGSFFRKDIFPDYKANRKGSKKPIGFGALKSEILFHVPNSMQHDKVEADDLIGIIATTLRSELKDYVIASRDKDLKQISGRHYWFDQDEEHITLEQAERNWWQQVLIGDRTDNIEGCPGIGKVRAEREVATWDVSRPLECWEKTLHVYRTKGKVEQPYESALLAARLTRLLRTGEYDFETKACKIWNPPTVLNASSQSISQMRY